MSDAEVAVRAGMRPAAVASGMSSGAAGSNGKAAAPAPPRRPFGNLGLAPRAALAMAALWLGLQAAGLVLERHAGLGPEQAALGRLAFVAAGALACALGAWLSMRAVARRLDRLGAAIGRIQAGEYRQPVRGDAADEIGQLARHLNRMREAITEREHRILNLALYDSLTGLPNRTLLIDRVGQAVRDAQRYKREFSLLMLDLDRFKLVNDTLGHGVGDEMLREVARRLGVTVRESDTVARLGGDEFIVLLTGGLDIATEIAQRILQSLQEPMRLDTQTVDLGASIGIACYPAHGLDVERLMRHADIAMYEAKRQQSGFVIFDGSDREQERSRLSMLGEMRKALERGEFAIDWQPRLALATGRVVGAEGLIRWNHPVRGRLGPAEFIPFAEETGFIREITRWVIATGVAQAAQMARDGLALHVSLNVSAHDIQHRQFADDVQRALRAEQLDPRQLCLEVTESGVLDDLDNALATLQSIAALGVRLSLDDFGTGYATLSQLQQLPMHELKIDRSFVGGMCANRGSEAIVRATIDLARKLGLSVAAEGVETGGELKALAALGCDEVQGFYVAKPMPAAELAVWVRRRHAVRMASESRAA